MESDQLIDKLDLENIKSITDYIIVNDTEIDQYLQMIGDELTDIRKGVNSILINSGYLIVCETFKKLYKQLSNYILTNKSSVWTKDQLPMLNYMLIFSPEYYTIYTIKKRILSEELADQTTLFNELSFINCINQKHRKCSIGWDYRLFIIKRLNSIGDDHITEFNDKYKSLLSIWDIKASNNVLCYDILKLQGLNEGDKRNYHLWKYVIHLSRHYEEDSERIFLFVFCLYNLINNPMDYSAFSNTLHFFYLKMGNWPFEKLGRHIDIVIKKFGFTETYLNRFILEINKMAIIYDKIVEQ
jgi:hypothetical protein